MFDIKKIYKWSFVALLNLFIVAGIANLPIRQPQTINKVSRVSTDSIPTPVTVVNQIIKKVQKYVYVTPNPNSNSKTNSTSVAQPTTAPQQQNQVTAPPAPQPTAAPAPVGCIITIDGGRYDVTQFRNQHSGGDIFNCGTDMSSIFWGRHGQSQFNRMQQYKI